MEEFTTAPEKHQVESLDYVRRHAAAHALDLKSVLAPAPTHFFSLCIYWDDTMSTEFCKLYDKIVTDLQWQDDLWKCWSGFSIKPQDSLWLHCLRGQKSDSTKKRHQLILVQFPAICWRWEGESRLLIARSLCFLICIPQLIMLSIAHSIVCNVVW